MSNILDLVKHFESLHDGDLKAIGLQPKLCPAGFWTIGYGHVVIDPTTFKALTWKTPYKDVVKFSLTDEAEALALLEIDFNKYRLHVKALVNPAINMTKYEEDALTSFCYNVGVGSLKSSTLLRLLNKGDRKGASLEFLKWCKAKDPKTGAMITLKGLERRRKSEKYFFETGSFKSFT